jgi:hypothetical protein
MALPGLAALGARDREFDLAALGARDRESEEAGRLDLEAGTTGGSGLEGTKDSTRPDLDRPIPL